VEGSSDLGPAGSRLAAAAQLEAILRAVERTGAFPASSPLHRLRAPRRHVDAEFTAAFVGASRHAARRPLHLVLDDLHEITGPEALASLDNLLRNALAGTTRAQASRPLGARRAVRAAGP
jgi:ATP/maltotriose-dependent transcriptional regulator MalT